MSLNPDLFKWIAIAMLAAFILLYLITHPGELRKLWQELLRLWGSLFGRGDRAFPADEDPQVEKNFKPRTPPRPFATYVDPFSTSSQRLSPAQIVTHSFAALEAWGAEHGMRRQEEQTAAEFARILSRRAASLGDSPVQAAQFLDRLMFAGWQPQIGEVQPLKDLWVKLRKGMPPPQE